METNIIANFPGRFDAGNSTVAGCVGNYRNGSDVATGLVYDAMNTPAAACATGANTGWIGSDPNVFGFGNVNGGDFTAITFRFTNFAGGTVASPKVFEFDCDIDSYRAGVSGAEMAGMVVKITFVGSITMRSELRVDPSTPQRSVAGF